MKINYNFFNIVIWTLINSDGNKKIVFFSNHGLIEKKIIDENNFETKLINVIDLQNYCFYEKFYEKNEPLWIFSYFNFHDLLGTINIKDFGVELLTNDLSLFNYKTGNLFIIIKNNKIRIFYKNDNPLEVYFFLKEMIEYFDKDFYFLLNNTIFVNNIIDFLFFLKNNNKNYIELIFNNKTNFIKAISIQILFND